MSSPESSAFRKCVTTYIVVLRMVINRPKSGEFTCLGPFYGAIAERSPLSFVVVVVVVVVVDIDAQAACDSSDTW